MNFNRSLQRWTLATLTVAAGTLALAPMAHADWGGWHRERPNRYHAWGGAHVIVRDHDGGGAIPFFAGLIGGAILGHAMSQPQQVVVHEHAVPVYRDQSCPPRDDRYYNDRDERGYREDRSYRDDDDDQPTYRDERGYSPAPQYDNGYGYDNGYFDQFRNAPQGQYRFEDGNGQRWWDTFDEATQAARGNRGPRTLKIVDSESNQVVLSLSWQGDHWVND